MLTLEILIPIVWLAVIVFVVAMCRLSARSDRESTARPPAAGWIEIGAFGFRGGAPGIRASGGLDRGENRRWSPGEPSGRPIGRCGRAVGRAADCVLPRPVAHRITVSPVRAGESIVIGGWGILRMVRDDVNLGEHWNRAANRRLISPP